MKKHSTIHSKLKQYSALAGVFMAGSTTAPAQIIYTDLNPDIIVDATSPEYFLDLNNDFNSELYFRTEVYQNSFTLNVYNAYDYDGSRLLVYPALNGGPSVRPLDYGYTINAAAERWRGDGFLARHSNGGNTSYPWPTTDKYIGVKFHFSFETGNHFGWVRVAVNTDDPFDPYITIKDIAYNSTKGQKIHAGEGTPNVCFDSFEPNNNFSEAAPLTIDESAVSLIKPSGDRDFYQFHVGVSEPNVQVILSGLPKNYDIKLYDESKELLLTSKNKQKENDTIVYNNAVAGDYYVKVYQKDNMFQPSECYALNVRTSSTPFKIAESQPYSDELSFSLFPNPANQFLTIQLDDVENDVAVSIFDLEGRELTVATIPSQTGSIELDISSLNSGMYLMRLVSGNQGVMKKFSVVK